ncbi:MAG TPA: hypothetical protein PKW50_04770 [Syntrophomonas sp.]|nr:hypothetical protein [Syntrophomonas sp.]
MRSNEFKIGMVLLALLIVLGALVGGQKLYNTNLIKKPVLEELRALSYVETAKIITADNLYQIKVHIRQPGNLKNEYNEIDKIVADNIRGHQYEIELVDKHDENLQNELQSMELSIYEAIAQNNYLDLEQRFADKAQRDHFDYLLQIDEQKLYVQISKSDRFLYVVIDRDDTTVSSGVKEE